MNQFHFSTKREALAGALSLTRLALSTRNTLPILNHVLLENESGKMRLSTTNLDHYMSVEIEGVCGPTGSFCLSHRHLSACAQALKSPQLELTQGEQFFSVDGMSARIDLISVAGEDFPFCPEITHPIMQFEINRTELMEQMRVVPVFCSKEEHKSILMGMYFLVKGDSIELASTDTHRLMAKTSPIKNLRADKGEMGVIVPGVIGPMLTAALKKYTAFDTVQVVAGASQIVFSFGPFKLTSRLLDGQFPNYEKVIPKKIWASAVINRANFLSSVQGAMLFASGRNSWKLDCEFQEQRIVTYLLDGETKTRYKSRVDGVTWEKNDAVPFQMTFNVRFMADMLQAFKSEYICFDFGGPLSPTLVSTYDIETKQRDYTQRGIVMPMQGEPTSWE